MAINTNISDDSTSLSTVDFNDEENQKISRIQTRFMEFHSKNTNKFYERDIELIKENYWWTLRFIKWNNGNEDKALKQMINAFEWRKNFGLYDRDVKDLPIEFAKAGAIFPLGQDYKGRNVLYIRVKVYRKIQVLNLFFQQFVTGIIDHIDKESGQKGFVVVFDANGLGWANIDFDFLQFLVQLLQSYYPYGLRYAICHNTPRYLRPLWSVVKVFLGSAHKTFRFVSGDEIQQFIPAERLPKYLGGECDFDFTNYEEIRNCPSVRELAPKHGFTDQEVEKLYKIFEPNLLEAQSLVKGQTETLKATPKAAKKVKC